MSSFADIYGHEKLIEHLQNAIDMGKVSHAYIFNGEKGSGKKLAATILAKTLQCEKGGIDPCNECHSCLQADSHNQPDIIWISHEKPNSIGVSDVREQLVSDILIKPYSSPKKIYIIDEAEKLTVEAQNAILKTIEEPPEYGIIILITTNSDSFLQTINSRCVKLDFKPVSDLLVMKYLKDNLHVNDYEAKFAAAFAQGRIGRAVDIVSNEEFSKLKSDVCGMVKYAEEMSVSDVLKAVKKATEYKLSINDYLDLCAMWYRDVLMFKSTQDGNVLIFKDEITTISEKASKCSYQGIQTILDAIETVKVRLKANVNFDLAIELLILTIKENS